MSHWRGVVATSRSSSLDACPCAGVVCKMQRVELA